MDQKTRELLVQMLAGVQPQPAAVPPQIAQGRPPMGDFDALAQFARAGQPPAPQSPQNAAMLDEFMRAQNPNGQMQANPNWGR